MRPTPQRVLVVEDDAMIQTLLSLHLEGEGLEVSRAATGEEMLGALASEDVDLIILDLNLPDSDGLDMAQQVRTRSSIPIIVSTARKSNEDRLRALGLGADDYLTKPFNPQELVLRVRNLLRRTVGGAGTVAQETPIPVFPPSPGPVVAPTPETLIRPLSQPRPDARPRITPADGLETNAGTAAKAPKRIETQGDNRGEYKSENRFFAPIFGLAVCAAIGIFWIFGGPEIPSVKTPLALPPVVSKVAAPTPLPAPVTAPALTETVIPFPALPAPPPPLKPKPVPVAPVAPVARETIVEVTPIAIEKAAPRPIAELLGYGWVLKTRCEAIPQVRWWKFKSHESIADYVQRRHGGDWTPYLEKWRLRLAKLQDIQGRQSSAVTNSGAVLRGEALEDYIGQMRDRLAVTRCLAGEAKKAANPSAELSR